MQQRIVWGGLGYLKWPSGLQGERQKTISKGTQSLLEAEPQSHHPCCCGFGRASKWLAITGGCVCTYRPLNLMRPRGREETPTVGWTQNRWHAVMRLCHSPSENKTLLFLCHLLQLSLYPLSVSLLPNQTCWKLHLMLQFRSRGEQSFARLSSGWLDRNWEISRSGDNAAHG